MRPVSAGVILMAVVRRAVVRDEPGRLPRHRHRGQGRHPRRHGAARHRATGPRLLGRGARSRGDAPPDLRLRATSTATGCTSRPSRCWSSGARSGTSAATGWRCSCRWPGPSARRSRAARWPAGQPGEASGWWAFWVVGLASPMAIYALDFWEHAPGVACIVGAVALLAGIVDGAPVPARALGAGALLGLAATMRTEALVYTLVAVGAAAVALLLQRRPSAAALRLGVLAVAGFAVPWVVEPARWRGGWAAPRGATGPRARPPARSARPGIEAARRSSPSSRCGPATRRRGAARWAGWPRSPSRDRSCSIVAASVERHAWLLAVAVRAPPQRARGRPRVRARPLLRRAGRGRCAGRASDPHGELATRSRSRSVALPLVWAFQYLGGANPQWAGATRSSSCIILVALGVAALQQVGQHRPLGGPGAQPCS